MIDKSEAVSELGFNYEPCCQIEALKRLARDLLDGKSRFSFEILAKRWGWVESEVIEFLHKLEGERIVALGIHKKRVVINFGKSRNLILHKIWH